MIAIILTFTTILAGIGVFILYIFRPLPIIVPSHNNIYIFVILIISSIIAFRNQSMRDYP